MTDRLPCTYEIQQNLPLGTTEEDYIAAMPVVCGNIRLDKTVCENIIDTAHDLYMTTHVHCGQCFNEYEAEKQRIAEVEAAKFQRQYRRVSFRKARLMREEELRRWEEESQRIADDLGLGGEEE